MPRRKKAPAIKIVAPEPLADEWETNLHWDRISTSGNPPAFFNGAHVFASENPFKIAAYDVKEPFPKSLNSFRPAITFERAETVFLRSERENLESVDKVKEGEEAISGYKFLHQAEEEASEKEQVRLQERYSYLLGGLENSKKQLDTIIQKTIEAFFLEQQNLLNRIYNLLLHDYEIEEAFNERMETIAECERVVEEYYNTHGQHVLHMEQLKLEASKEKAATIQRMKDTLHRTACDLMETVIPEGEDVGSERRRRALIQELLLLERHSATVLQRKDEVLRGNTDLERLVSLETQRLSLIKTRNKMLKAQLKKLNELSQQAATSRKSTSEATFVVGVELHHEEDNELADEMADPINLLNALRTEFDKKEAEVEEQNEKLRQLRQYHLIQLSGRYKPVRFSADAIKTTRSFLDPETNAAVRSVITEAMLEVDSALQHLNRCRSAVDGEEKVELSQSELYPETEAVLPDLSRVMALADRKAVQNFVASRINKLFSNLYPTTPALTLLENSLANQALGRQRVSSAS